MRPLIGVFTSERHAGALATLQRCDESAPADGAAARDAVPARDRGRRRAPRRARAGRRRRAADALLDRLDGLCLAGGPDLDPLALRRRATRHERLGPTDRVVDAAELALARAADARGLPLLGICRGAQAMNVARGGTLHQHVDDHRQTTPATEAVARRRRRRPARCSPALTGARRARGQLLPPPGRRPRSAPACAVSATRRGRHRRGARGPVAPVPARRAVARRGDGRAARAARAVRARSSRPPPRRASRSSPELAERLVGSTATVNGSCRRSWTSSRRSSSSRSSRRSTSATSSSRAVARPSAGTRTSRRPASSSSTSAT